MEEEDEAIASVYDNKTLSLLVFVGVVSLSIQMFSPLLNQVIHAQ